MAVIMSYHKLVERDAKKIDHYWKTIIVTLLVVGTISCFITSFSLDSIIKNYTSRCVLNSNLQFEERSNDLKTIDFNISKEYSKGQSDFIEKFQVSQLKSEWGREKTCQFGIFLPIFEAFFAVIMTTMFMICGHGGKSEPQDFLPQPWRIVMPSLVFFFSMTIVSIAHLVLILDGMKSFCGSFAKELPGVGCDQAIQVFAIKNVEKDDNSIFQPALLYKLLVIFVWIILTAWVTAFITLLLRVIFVIDFQLVKVTIKSHDYERMLASTVFKTEDDRSTSKAEDDISSSSKSSYKLADDQLGDHSEQTITEQIDEIVELASKKIAMRDKKKD